MAVDGRTEDIGAQARAFAPEGVDASCVADHPLDRFGRGDIYLVVPPEQWSRATEIFENLDDDD